MIDLVDSFQEYLLGYQDIVTRGGFRACMCIARRWDWKASIDGKHQDLTSMDFDDGLISTMVKDNLRTTEKKHLSVLAIIRAASVGASFAAIRKLDW
jgi:hypothetical protein